jgi:hypothetical protein
MYGRIGLALGALLLAVVPPFAPSYYTELGTYAMISAMLALSLPGERMTIAPDVAPTLRVGDSVVDSVRVLNTDSKIDRVGKLSTMA